MEATLTYKRWFPVIELVAVAIALVYFVLRSYPAQQAFDDVAKVADELKSEIDLCVRQSGQIQKCIPEVNGLYSLDADSNVAGLRVTSSGPNNIVIEATAVGSQLKQVRGLNGQTYIWIGVLSKADQPLVWVKAGTCRTDSPNLC